MKFSVPVLASGLLLLAGCAESSDIAVGNSAAVDSTGAEEAAASVDAPVESTIEPGVAEPSVTTVSVEEQLPVILMMMYSREAGTEVQLRGFTKSSEVRVRGVATYALGSYLAKKDDQSLEARELLQSVVDEYADVSFDLRGNEFKIAPEADVALFALNNLQIGMMAPDIEGADLDGVDFKLSDYRGKVILLDFWGNW